MRGVGFLDSSSRLLTHARMERISLSSGDFFLSTDTLSSEPFQLEGLKVILLYVEPCYILLNLATRMLPCQKESVMSPVFTYTLYFSLMI